MEGDKIDYAKEAQAIRDYAGSFKPEAGKYEIVCLSELVETQYTDEEGKVTPQAKVEIEVNGSDRYVWFMGLSKTTKGIFGQLTLLAQEKGKLMEEKFTLVVKRSNNKNDYTILEALELVNKKNETTNQS